VIHYSSYKYFREYAVFSGMKSRCYNPNHPGYKNYGKRGIAVCNLWLGPGGFQHFMNHLGPRPSDRHSIDRYPNNDGNYEPGNVRWATQAQQMNNTRRTRMYILHGTKTSRECADELGVSIQSVYYMVKKGRLFEIKKNPPKPVFRIKKRPFNEVIPPEEAMKTAKDEQMLRRARRIFERVKRTGQ